MIFSKSFGYAVRSILYLSLEKDNKPYVQAEEIAGMLNIPRHFAGKILKTLVKEGVLSSIKGPSGGFALNEKSLRIPLYDIYAITDDLHTFSNCAMRFNQCNQENPCPLHEQMLVVRNELKHILTDNNIGNLLKEDKPGLLKSITATETTENTLTSIN